MQITESKAHNGVYPVKKLNNTEFEIGLKWQPGEAVNLKSESRKRRGLVFDGVDDRITIHNLPLPMPSPQTSFSETYSAWIYIPANSSDKPQWLLGRAKPGMHLELSNGRVTLQFLPLTDAIEMVQDPIPAPVEQWVHYTGVLTYNATPEPTITLMLCRNGELVAEPTTFQRQLLKFEPHDWQRSLFIGGTDAGELPFAGRIAEVQAWSNARTPQQIKDTMYVHLNGEEADLVGHWHLSSLLNGEVLDFSPHGNNGIVHGDPYVSAVMLDRRFKDEAGTLVRRYTNRELIAVTQGAVYTESFEFCVRPTRPDFDPNQVDSEGNKLFELSYKGQRSRDSQDEIEFAETTTQFSQREDGWFVASCRFRVPDGVNLMRSFEIANLHGDWEAVEIRKHRLELNSNSITLATYHDRLPTTSLSASNAHPVELWQKITALERRENALLTQKQQLEAQIALLNSENLSKRLEEQNGVVRQLQGEAKVLEDVYNQELNNPFNYYFWLTSGGTGFCLSEDGKVKTADATSDAHLYWRVIVRPDEYYFLQNGKSGKILDSSKAGKVYGSEFDWNNTNQQWELRSRGNGYYSLINRQTGRALDSNSKKEVYTSEFAANNPYEYWRIDRTSISINEVVSNAKKNWDDKLAELSTASNKLAEEQALYDKTVANRDRELERLNDRLNGNLQKEIQGVLPTLQQVQKSLKDFNSQFQTVAKSAEAIAMPLVHTDKRGLKTQAARLDFVRPQSRMSAIETCEGNVQLSYFDDLGRMRQTNFDATAYSRNTDFGQWIPDTVRVCPAPSDKGVLLIEEPIQLFEQWTFETWFSFPLPEPLPVLKSQMSEPPSVLKSQLFPRLPKMPPPVIPVPKIPPLTLLANLNYLTSGNSDGVSIVAKDGKQLFLVHNNQFYDCGCNLELVSLLNMPRSERLPLRKKQPCYGVV